MIRLTFFLFLGACGATTHPTENPVEDAAEPQMEQARPSEESAAAASTTDEQPSELARLVASIDENPDNLHLDLTPSVHALSALGLPGARAVIPLLAVDEHMTRLHAQRVVELVVSREFGFRPGSGFPSLEMDEAARRVIVGWGYAHDAAETDRRRAIERIAASLNSLPNAAEREPPAP
ncbi:MAG: hypothetical protein ACI9KE_002149 [Polyangiales bacterium]|jgi:hypothetical protein